MFGIDTARARRQIILGGVIALASRGCGSGGCGGCQTHAPHLDAQVSDGPGPHLDAPVLDAPGPHLDAPVSDAPVSDAPGPHLDAPVSEKGSLVLSFAALPATTNCKPARMNGAGITGITITLVQVAGGCAPVTFIRSRGTAQLGTYTVNCSSPAVATCIETDETLTVASMPSQRYTIQVRGKIGAIDCWTNDDTLDVPPSGGSLMRTLKLTHQDIPGC
jgi:hypothetical protein